MKRAHLAGLASASLLLPLLSACGAGASDGRPQVVASFYPLQFVAERIVGDHAEVTNLTNPGAEPHDLQLTPRQVASVADADVAFYEKGLQPSVDQAIENDPPKRALDVTAVVKLSEAADGVEGTEDEHGDHAEGEDHDHEEEGHDHGGLDPHFWQDPTLLAKAADAFTAEMSKADPDNAADYEANNKALQADLTSLDTDIEKGLADCTTRTIVVSHDAFEYFGRRYDLDVHPIAGLSPDAEPSAKQLAELADLIETDKISTVFNERLASPKLADALANDAGVKTAVLDPLEGLTDDDSDATYLTIMRANLKAIQQANSCT